MLSCSSSLRSQHVLRADPLVELLLVQVAQLQGGLLQRRALLVGRLGNLGRLVVPNVRVQRRHQHQRLVHDLVNVGPVRLDADDAVLAEGACAVGWFDGRID